MKHREYDSFGPLLLLFVAGVGFTILVFTGIYVDSQRRAAAGTTTFDTSSDGPFGPQYDLLSCLADLERYEQASGLTLEQARNLDYGSLP